MPVNKLLSSWRSYRHRFVPWLTLNLKNRKLRVVPDKVVPDTKIVRDLTSFFEVLYEGKAIPSKIINRTTGNEATSYDNVSWNMHIDPKADERGTLYVRFFTLGLMKKVFGFTVEQHQSSLKNAGRGVFVTSGTVPKNSIVALYPGTIYEPLQPIFFQSIANPFIFRCVDGVYIDGNDGFFSSYIFKSCSNREKIALHDVADMSWFSENLSNPLCCGQYVNNQTSEYPANVVYQEINLDEDALPLHLLQYVPNIHFSAVTKADYDNDNDYVRSRRLVALVSLREIQKGEELFSNYFTVVQ